MAGPRSVATATALVVAACGGTPAGPRPCPSQPVAGPHAQTGPVAVDADRRQVPAGATVTFAVTVTGPAQYQADCAGPVQLLVDDAADIRVYAATSAAGIPTNCGNVTLAAAHRNVYSISWQPDPTLPPGAYVATVLLGDQPAVAVPVSLVTGTDRSGCGANP